MRRAPAAAHASREGPLGHLRSVPRWIAFALLLVPSLAEAQPRPVVNQRVVGLLNPMGVEHAVGVGLRAPIGDPAELLFSGAHVELGAVNYTSPIYTRTGGYLELSPIAPLVLRVEAAQATVWPIGLDGAGYFPSRDGQRPSLEGARGEAATGWDARASAVLQMAFPLGPLRLVLWNESAVELVQLGDAPYHFSARHDAVLARRDFVVSDWGMAMLEIPIGGWALRLGVYDEVRAVPRSGWLANQLGGIAMLSADRVVPEIGSVAAFVRAGAYTHHQRRAGDPALLLGVMVRYELTP